MQDRLVSFSLLRRLPSNLKQYKRASLSSFQRGAFFFLAKSLLESNMIAFALADDFMVNGIALRDYRAEDLDAMFRLDEACFAEEFRFSRESMREFAEQPDSIVRVAAKTGGEIVGFVIAHVEQVASERRAYLVTLDVAAEWRRKGLAGRLMGEVETWALNTRVPWMQLHVFTGNTGAIRFYERMGYERIRTRRGFYGGRGLDAFVYGKELGRKLNNS
jgi:ribosomal-protein-alanine N-acetyltransferase